MSSARNVQRMIASVQRANAWRDNNNPLRSLTMPRAVRMLEAAQRGMMADLMWCYETGIEITDPDLMVIIDRSVEAICDMEWQVERVSDETRGYDETLADEQEAFLRETYERIENLYEAIAHLAMYPFRGFAHLNPWYRGEDALAVYRLQPLDQWNMVRDGYKGGWAYDPEARQASYGTLSADARLAPEDYILCERRLTVNRIGLIKYVRATTAEKDWDCFVETYGLPGVFLVAPEGTAEADMATFEEHANRAAEGGSGALPPGTTVHALSEIRGNQPFNPRLEWLQKQLVLAGTGGLLTVLTESGSGTLAGSVHEQAFRQLGRGRARRISEALQRQFDKRLLAAAFPDKPALAYFELKARQEKDTGKFIANVVALRQAGYVVDPDEVAQETGYTVISVEPLGGAQPPPASATAAAKADERGARVEAAGDAAEQALRMTGREALARAVAQDLAPVRAAIEAALAEEDDEAMMGALVALYNRAPELLLAICDAPAAQGVLEGVIGAAMFNGFAEGAAARRGKSVRGEG